VAWVIGLGSSLPGVARASDLSWSGPADCAQSEQLVFQVERALGAPLAAMGNLHLQVHVARTAPTARALLRIAEEAPEPSISERKLDAPSCEKLVDTLAVAIALAIEAAAPEPVAAPKPPPPAAPPPVAPVPSAAPVAVDTLEPEDDTRGPIPRVLVRLVGDVGSLPAPALGIGLGAQLGWSGFQLELTGTLWAEQHTSLGTAADVGADLSLATGGLAACTSPLATSSFVFALCLGAEVGRASGLGTGISAPRGASGLWLAPTADIGLTWRPSARGVGVGARLGAAAPLGRDPFYLERLGTVHQAESLVARASFSIEVALP
jgi:hypothetical protein